MIIYLICCKIKLFNIVIVINVLGVGESRIVFIIRQDSFGSRKPIEIC